MKITHSRNRSGFVYIILSIIVAIVAGVIIYGLVRLIHLLNNKPKNDDTTYYSDGDGTVWSAIPTGQTNQPPKATNITPADLLPCSFCTFQYRVMVDSNNIPCTTLVMGTNMVDGGITVLINTPDEYEISFIVAGQSYVEDYDAVTGETISETISPAYTGSPFVSVVQRMSPGGWQDIDTNTDCEVGTIYTFTDPTPPADAGFYRLMIQ